MKWLATLLMLCAAALWLSSSSDKQSQLRVYKNAVQPACVATRFESDPFTVCRVNPARHTVQLVLSDADAKPLRNFSALERHLGPEARRVVFAMNAGMYDANGNPIGLYVENGQERAKLNRADGTGNFYMKPNGVFWIDAKGGHIAPSDSFAALARSGIQWATQSGPILVTGGKMHARVTPDGASRYIRNAVGVTKGGATLFVISDTRVSFGKIARLMRDQLDCPDILYLDGYVSSLWDGASGRNDQDLNIGPMVVVMEK